MSEFVEDKELQELFTDFLKYVPDPVSSEGELSLPNIIIPEINKNECLKFPLSNDIIKKIKSISKPSLFGQDINTKYDENIRKGFELDTSQFKINTNFSLNSKNFNFLENIRRELSSHIEYIEC